MSHIGQRGEIIWSRQVMLDRQRDKLKGILPVDFRQLWSQLNFELPPHYNLQSWSVPVRGLMMQLLQIQGEGTAYKKTMRPKSHITHLSNRSWTNILSQSCFKIGQNFNPLRVHNMLQFYKVGLRNLHQASKFVHAMVTIWTNFCGHLRIIGSK